MKYCVEFHNVNEPNRKFRSMWYQTKAEAVVHMQKSKEIDEQLCIDGNWEYCIIEQDE